MKDNQKILVGILVGILIIGAVSVFIFIGSKEGEEGVTSAVIPEVNSNEVIETEEPNIGSVPATEDSPAPTEVVAEENLQPTPRSGLESTDPSVVNLASGEIQLVEFFAFW